MDNFRIINIDASQLKDWDSFHAYFKESFGFPEFYGENMNAWIDCMTCLDDPGAGLTTKINIGEREAIVFQLQHMEELKNASMEIYLAFIECAAFVNYRRIENGL